MPRLIEHGKICLLDATPSAGIGESRISAISFHADDPQRDITDIKDLLAGERDARAKPSHASDLFNAAVWIDSINLPRFPASPKNPFMIERAAFWMVQPFGIDFKRLHRNLRLHR